MSDQKNIENILADKFQQLSDINIPDDVLKIEVFKTVDRIKHLAEIADLFTSKFVKTEIDLIVGGTKISDET